METVLLGYLTPTLNLLVTRIARPGVEGHVTSRAWTVQNEMRRTICVALLISQLTSLITSRGALSICSCGSSSTFSEALTGPGRRTSRSRLVAKHVRSVFQRLPNLHRTKKR